MLCLEHITARACIHAFSREATQGGGYRGVCKSARRHTVDDAEQNLATFSDNANS